MNRLLILFTGTLGIRMLGYKLLKEAGHNHGLKYTIKISESQQSETSLPNISKEEIKKLWFKNLRLTDLFNWNSTLKKWIKIDIKEVGLFKLTGNAKGFKSYSVDEAISPSGILHVMDPEPYQSNSTRQNDKVRSECLPSIINIYKETLRRYVLTFFMLILHITTFQKKTSSNFKKHIGQIFGILRYSLNDCIINY